MHLRRDIFLCIAPRLFSVLFRMNLSSGGLSFKMHFPEETYED